MRNRWTRRSLVVLVFTFFIVVFVDFQLRTSSFTKSNVAHRPSAGARHGSIGQVPSAHSSVYNSSSSINGGGRESKLSENNGGESVAKRVHATQPKLRLDDIYVAVKTTARFHKTRLALLLDTWISRTKAHVSVCLTSHRLMEI